MTPASFKHLDGRPAPSTRQASSPASTPPGRAPAARPPAVIKPTPIRDALDDFSFQVAEWWEGQPWPWAQPPFTRLIGQLKYWARNLAWDLRDRLAWHLARAAYKLAPRAGHRAQYQTCRFKGLAYTVAEFGWPDGPPVTGRALPLKKLRDKAWSLLKSRFGGLLCGLALLASEVRS